MNARAYAWLALAAALVAAGAQAQSFPSRPITILISTPPGGGTDLYARQMAPLISKSVGQPVVVENRTGAGGVVAHEYLARKAPDGYTYLITAQSQMVLATGLSQPLPYDTVKDFSPVTMMIKFGYFLVVGKGFPANSVQEFVAQAKAAGGKLAMGTSQSPGYLVTVETLKQRLGIDFVLATYKGASPSIPELMAGRLQALVIDTPSASSHVRSGAMRAIATTVRERLAGFPEVPTFNEAGLPGFESIGWSGFITTAGAPREAIERMSAEFGKAMKTDEIMKSFASTAVEGWITTPQEMANVIREELRVLPPMVKKLNIQAN